MRYLFFLLTLLLPLSSGAKQRLFHNGKSDYVIYLHPSASTSEQTAAVELQEYLKEMSGVELALLRQESLPKGEKCLVVGYNEELGNKVGVGRPAEGDERFTYCTVGKHLWVYGGAKRGTMYGVYALLERELGVRWFTPDHTFIPKRSSWQFGALHHTEAPLLDYRFALYYHILQHPEFMAHNRLNSCWDVHENAYGGTEGFWGSHSFHYFFPWSTYYTTHPEYFSLHKGERHRYSQLCLSNPDVLRICTEGMIKVIRENPNHWVYSLSQNDNNRPCECEKCRAIEEQYGGHSGLLIWFTNQVAAKVKELFPDKKISTFAYRYSRQAPKGIVPADNVVVRLCSIECCFGHPLESDCKFNTSFMHDIEEWSKITDNLFIWDYVVNFQHYLIPFPNFSVLAKNIQTYARHNVIGIQEQAQYQTEGGEWSELRGWVLSKLLWDPYQDGGALVREFIAGHYGAAAPHIQRYWELSQALIKPESELTIYIEETSPIYTEEFITEGRKILDEAQKAVAGDAVLTARVDRVRLQILYLYTMHHKKEARAEGVEEELFRLMREGGIRYNEWTTPAQFEERYYREYPIE